MFDVTPQFTRKEKLIMAGTAIVFFGVVAAMNCHVHKLQEADRVKWEAREQHRKVSK